MQPDTQKLETPKNEGKGNFVLLQYEINRVKSHLDSYGESTAMRDRLHRLEALLETCLASPAKDQFV